jgi:parallel beta-helix repeat protein
MNNTVSNNKNGIELYNSGNSTLDSNVMFENDYNFGVFGSALSDFLQNIYTTNTADGKPVYYCVNQQNIQIPNDAGYIGVVNSTNVTLRDLTLQKNLQGVLLAYSNYSNIENINASHNLYYGIELLCSNKNRLHNNIVMENGYGIELLKSSCNELGNNILNSNDWISISLFNSNNNTFEDNIASNAYRGVLLSDSRDNRIYLNDFINNTEKVYSDDSTNTWNSTSKITYFYNGSEFENYLGNYWDDYSDVDANRDGIWDNPYSIDGDQDYYPLKEKFENYVEHPKLNVSIETPPDNFSTVAGLELIVKATVRDEDTFLHNATVDGKLSSNSFELYDDGRSSHGDDAKDDGIYSAKLTVPKVQNAILEITARYEGNCGSASRSIDIDTSTKQPLKVEAEIIDDNPPTFTGDTVKVRAVVSLNGSIVSDAEVKSMIIYPNSYQKNITLQNKGDYYEADFDWLFQGGEFTFDVIAYPQENAIQGYDTEKLKVYHGYLSLTQEDTGAVFKKGEPVDFMVEAACTGLTCPDEVTNAEVIMEILPDGEEITLVRNGDGTYKAGYIFTTSGIRDIKFSAHAPFRIPAKINGKSIEIKEEDYEMKKAVEDFANDSIEILDETKFYAADLGLAGDYFFRKMGEDASATITNLVFIPLSWGISKGTKYLPETEGYKKFIERIIYDRVVHAPYDILKDKFQEGLTNWILQDKQPFIEKYFPKYLENISYSKEEINKSKQAVITDFCLIPEAQRALYFTDLNKRKLANDMITDIIHKEVNVPCEVHKKELAKDTDWLRIFCLDWGDTFIRIGFGYFGLSPLVDISKATYNLYSVGKDWQMVILTLNTFSDISIKSDKITKNTISGILQFKDANPPQIPEIKMYLTDVSEGNYIPVLWLWDEKECYTDILFKNTGETPANISVVKSLHQDYTRVVDHGKEKLEPGESKTFKIDYEKRPKDGSYVSFYVFSETDEGIYFVDYKLRSFSPIRKEILSDTAMRTSITKYGRIAADQLENVTVISHPIKTTLAMVNMTTYEVIVTAINPFAYPINAEITQNTSSWNISIPPRDRKVLNYTIHPELGVETTIPPAYMEYFDFQHNVTVTFASDAINFTATGIAIIGYLPYEISDHVKVNLSITNLVNITNGAFNLTLVGDETFKYNATANIENVSTLTVEFGPIDAPEGEYIGILTFGWDDENLTVDARNMQKSAPIIILDTGTASNPYPSIMGNHTGTIKPNHTVIATKLCTYPCRGTGGHTEYAEIRNATWNATATWKGYAGDWHNITFDKTVVLLTNETYNYIIRTGSYPQIIHEQNYTTLDGSFINCTKFTDANGKKYNNWIPAIRLH